MGLRVDFQALLESLLGSANVYFQPPPGHMLSYPCIVYSRNNIHSSHADNAPYKLQNSYTVTAMDVNPDSEIPAKLAALPQSQFDRHFTASNLNHDVFTILY